MGQEDPLEKGMATHSSILAWRMPWTEEPVGLQSMGHKEIHTTEQLTRSGTWAQLLWCIGLIAPWHVESSVARNQTYCQADSPQLDDQGSPQLNILNVDIMNSQKAKNAFVR